MLANPQRLNRYVYALSNPYKYVDPDGEFAVVLAVWAAVEVGLSISDGVSMVQTLASDASIGEKSLSVGLFAAGVVGPGGGGSTVLRNANKIKLSHPAKLSSKFSNPAHGTVSDLAQGLKNGDIKATDIKPIAITKINGTTYSFDNRRLRAFQEAGVDVPTVPATKKQAAVIKKRVEKRR